MNDASAGEFGDWIGRSVTEDGLATAQAANCFAATLDQEDPPFRDGDPLPPGWHYFCFHEAVPLAQTGADGHAEKGDFTPPFPAERRMWAGSKMQFRSPIRVGEELRKVITISDISVKDGKTGPLHFITTTEDVLGEDGRLTTREERTRVYRGAPDPDAPPPRPQPAPADAVWSRAIHPSSVLLFRYSALTMNSHRIHYDRDYVRDVEGHPGLLVHGPLTMTLMLELFRREMPDATLTSMDLRAVAPIYDTEDFSVHGAPRDGGCLLWAMTGAGALAMKAEVAHTA